MQAFGTLSCSMGIKKSLSTVIDHPALVLTPAFSFWTFGPVRADGCCAYRRKEAKICLSFRLTWFNTFLTFCGMLALLLITIMIIPERRRDLLWSLFGLCFFAGAIICLLLIQFLDKCKWLCCGFLCCCCWKKYEDCCFPMTQKIVYNAENHHQ